MALMFMVLSIVVNILFIVDKRMITLNYWQLALAFLVIPAAALWVENPHIIKKAIPTTIFFATVFFVHELISLKIGHWWWPGQYLLPISISGQTFPIDDVIIWYFLSTPVLIGGFEFFFDDFK